MLGFALHKLGLGRSQEIYGVEPDGRPETPMIDQNTLMHSYHALCDLQCPSKDIQLSNTTITRSVTTPIESNLGVA